MGYKISKKQLLEAVEQSKGIIVEVARLLGTSWHTAKRQIEKYPEAEELLQQKRAVIGSMAVSRLFEAVEAGEQWAIDRVLGSWFRGEGLAPAPKAGEARPDDEDKATPPTKIIFSVIDHKPGFLPGK